MRNLVMAMNSFTQLYEKSKKINYTILQQNVKDRIVYTNNHKCQTHITIHRNYNNSNY